MRPRHAFALALLVVAGVVGSWTIHTFGPRYAGGISMWPYGGTYDVADSTGPVIITLPVAVIEIGPDADRQIRFTFTNSGAYPVAVEGARRDDGSRDVICIVNGPVCSDSFEVAPLESVAFERAPSWQHWELTRVDPRAEKETPQDGPQK